MHLKRLLTSLILGLGVTLALLWLLSAGPVTSVHAATYTVTNTAPSGAGSLRQAILDANANAGHDTVDFGVSGTVVLTDALPAIADDLTIAGPGADQLAISGAGAYRVFEISSGSSVTISGVTVRDGSADNGGGVWSVGDLHLNAARVVSNAVSNHGGGVYIFGGSATLSGTQIISNATSSNGGGMYVHAGSVALTGTHVADNVASEDGGGVFIGSGSATLTSTQVISNAASYHGGGVFVSDGSATLEASGGEIGGNTASLNGGGMYVWWGSATLSGTRVIDNDAHGSTINDGGGGMYVSNGRVTLIGTRVAGNATANDGGGAYVYLGNATLKGSGGEFYNNVASRHGGGLRINIGGATLTGTCVISNAASRDGGGVYSGGSAALTGTQVFSNLAYRDGGGVFVFQGNTTLSDTQVVSNTALDGGGGMFVDQAGAILNASGGRIDANAGGGGGGVYVSSGDAVLSGTQVFSNVATSGSGGDGGGVCVEQGSATLTGTHVVRNAASRYGGGVYINMDGATLRVSRGRIDANSAVYDGGGVYVRHGDATLTGTHVISNAASSDGGGLYRRSSSTGAITATNGCIVHNSHTAVDNDDVDVLNARDTWWGVPNGPSGAGSGNGDSVSANVDYANFKTSPPAGCPTLPPDIAVLGNGQPIVAGDNTPTTDDDTDFGSVPVTGGSVTHTFTLSNAGGADLTLTGSPAVALSTATAFAVTQPASTTLGSGEATTFSVTFDPPAAGTFTDTVIIDSNDPDGHENPHTFMFSGIASPPPAPDLTIIKTVTPTAAAPGAAVTYTLVFSNAGSATAAGVVITDAIPISVTHTSVVSSSNASTPLLAITPRPGARYVWDIADLAQDQGGTITVTGLLSPSLAAGPFTNTATIATTPADDDMDDNNNTGSAGVTVTAHAIYLPLVLKNQ